MKTNLWTKKNLQRVLASIRKLKNDALSIESTPNEMRRYKVTLKGKTILEALNGQNGYLVRYEPNFFHKPQ